MTGSIFVESVNYAVYFHAHRLDYINSMYMNIISFVFTKTFMDIIHGVEIIYDVKSHENAEARFDKVLRLILTVEFLYCLIYFDDYIFYET